MVNVFVCISYTLNINAEYFHGNEQVAELAKRNFNCYDKGIFHFTNFGTGFVSSLNETAVTVSQ